MRHLKGVFDLRMAVAQNVVAALAGADGKPVIFHSAGAIEAPGVLGNLAGQLHFPSRAGLEVSDQLCAEGLDRLVFFSGQEGHLACEAVAPGVEADALLPFFGTRAGGELGVVAMYPSEQTLLK